MADAAISSAVELLGNLLIEKVKSLRGVKGKVRLLKDELKSMQSFLRDANRRQAKEERVRDWLRDLREIAFDAEDAIEMFLVNVENVKSRGLVKRCTSFPVRMYHLGQIGDEIDSISARLARIHERRVDYGIQILEEAEVEAKKSQIELLPRLSPWQKDEHLVGMEDDVKEVLREVVNDREKRGLFVAVILGMGGIGKSTLAREIYNHPDVSQFDRRGWVVVSSEFTPLETIKQLIFELSGSEEEKNRLLEQIQRLEQSMNDKNYLLEKLKEMLQKQLLGSTYFIVLDDLWEQDHWECLKTAFPDQQDKTSRVILTGRNKIITKHDYVYKKKLLDPENSWELFLKKAYVHISNGTCPEELESIGRQILEKCDGLPLAISVAGGLLMDAQDKRRWQEVLNQIDSNIPENNVPNILGLSYQNLSPQLKACFLCLAFFKEDFTIPSNELASIWHAHGLIQEKGSRSIKDSGRRYLNELINRSMLQIQDLTIDGQVKSFRLHDLLREVCLSKANEEMGVKIVKGEVGGCSSESSYKDRHHVVYCKAFEPLEPLSSNQNKYLRSLFLNVEGKSCILDDIPSPYWKSFRLLKILNLDGFTKLPNSFRRLVGLKYLRIHANGSFEFLKLPSWLVEFKKLEFLYVEHVEFSDVALKMESLLDFGTSDVKGRPMKVEMWKSIESLKGIRLCDWMSMSSGLMPNSHLRELGINGSGFWGANDDQLSRVRESLQKMTNLVKLHLKLNDFPEDTWSKLIPNLESLTSLTLDTNDCHYECPAACVFPPNLSHLTLNGTKDVSMEELGKLPKLQYLTLKRLEIDGMMKILHDGFPRLKALSLKDIGWLSCIDIEEGGMPCLKQIRIRKCPRMESTENLPKHITISVT